MAMRRIRLLIFLFTGIFVFGSCENNTNIKKGTEKFLPRLQLQKGDQYEVIMEIIQSISTNENETEEVIDQSITIDFLVTVDSVAEEKYYFLKADVKEVAITRNIPLQETIEINSEDLNKKDLDSQYVKRVKALLERKVILNVDDQGVIRSRKILVKSDSAVNHDRLLPAIFEEHVSTRQNFELFFPYYPKDSIVVNQPWNQEFLLQSGVPILAKSNIIIDSIYSDTISMQITTTLNQQKSGDISKSEAQKSRSGNQSVEALINRNTGWPISVEILSEVKVMEKIGLKILKTTSTTINFNSSKINKD